MIIGWIQSFRAIAIIPVFLLHYYSSLISFSSSDNPNIFLSDLLNVGGWGVRLFFVISGFIIFHQLSSLITSVKSPFTVFFKRRIMRLLPEFYLSVFLIYFILSFINFSDDINLYNLFLSLFGLSSLLSGTFSPINPVIWSLEVEFQFYLIAPLIFIFSILNSRFLFLVLLLFLYILSINFDGGSFVFLYLDYSIFEFLHFFILGIFLYIFYRSDLYSIYQLSYSSHLFLFLSSFSLLYYSLLISSILLESLSYAMMFLIFIVFKSGLLSSSFFQFIGQISYSIYLWHYAIIYSCFLISYKLNYINNAIIFCASILLTLLVSYFSNKYINFKFFKKPPVSA